MRFHRLTMARLELGRAEGGWMQSASGFKLPHQSCGTVRCRIVGAEVFSHCAWPMRYFRPAMWAVAVRDGVCAESHIA